MNYPLDLHSPARAGNDPGCSRSAMLATLDRLIQGWACDEWQYANAMFTDDCVFHSSAHGDARGSDAIAAMLRRDHASGAILTVQTTNHYAAGLDREGVLSGYAYGERTEGAARLTFGATMTGRLCEEGGRWRFSELRLSVNWLDGDTSLTPGWKAPAGDLGWQVGDAAPTIVSEMDSPWSRLPAPSIEGDLNQQLAETFSRYAWAIDQGDIALLATCFTADAAGDFPPLGHLKGRHHIIGHLKSFRQLWPWMQHFGRPLLMEIDPAGTSARMVIGRVIPQRPSTPEGLNLYGAQYELTLRREQSLWKIEWFDYRSGWFAGVPGEPSRAARGARRLLRQ